MKKSERIGEFVEGLQAASAASEFDRCYLGYFECFNRQLYYEAHDVLEHLWLKDGRNAPDYRFHKGLIQLAGAFVHMKLHREHPSHPKHGRRLPPARRLLVLASENLAPFAPRHHGFDVSAAMDLAARFLTLIEEGSHERNPWDPKTAPILPLPEDFQLLAVSRG
jgi:hypothetical protein